MISATLALDMGRVTGWAIGWSPERVESGTFPLLDRSDRGEGYRFSMFHRFLHDTKHRIELAGGELAGVLYENPAGLRWKTVSAAELAFGLKAVLLNWCEHHRIPYRGIVNSTLKKRMTGRGDAPKTEAEKAERNAKTKGKRRPYDGPTIESALLARGHRIDNHNQADALALLLCEGS